MIATPDAPTIETARLRLRGWKSEDFEPYATMLADIETARFITRRGRPYSEAEAWAETAFLVGHWQLLKYGMFVVEERRSGAFVGRVGPIQPRGWPGLEVAWALSPNNRGRGYATEAAGAVVRWCFETLSAARIVSIIHRENLASQAVAKRLGERLTEQHFSPFKEPCDVWELERRDWEAVATNA